MQQEQKEITQEQFNSADTMSASNGKKKWGRVAKIATAGLLSLAIGAGIFCAGWFGYSATIDSRMKSLMWAISQTEQHYYQQVDTDKLYTQMFNVLNDSLDAHSYYISAEENQIIEQQKAGQNSGIGISLTEEAGRVRLASVGENSPACFSGLQAGMYVNAYSGADGQKIVVTDTAQVVAFVGLQSGEFTLYCSQNAQTEGTPYRLKKQDYHSAYVVYADSECGYAFRGKDASLAQTQNKMPSLDAKTAYIKLSSFNGTVVRELATCLSKMKERGRENLILDLRGNGGGFLDKLCGVASLLIDTDERTPLIAVAKYRDGKEDKFYGTGGAYQSYFTPQSKITVLADAATASASEALIGALLDYGSISYQDIVLHDWAGARTYGKGIMQTYYSNLSGEAMRLTVATVHWPKSHKCIHEVGITAQDGAQSISVPRFDEENFFASLFNR